jgi:hypothetical protein
VYENYSLLECVKQLSMRYIKKSNTMIVKIDFQYGPIKEKIKLEYNILDLMDEYKKIIGS